MCVCHYRQVPTVPKKKTVSKTGRFRVGQRKKRLPGQIDETCTALVGTLIPPQKKKKEDPGSKFKCNYSGHDKPDSQVFDDKNLELLEQNGWGGGGKRLPKNWADREKTYNDLIRIMGQKVQCLFLSGLGGGADGSQRNQFVWRTDLKFVGFQRSPTVDIHNA